MIVELQNIRKHVRKRGVSVLFDNFSIAIAPGDHVALLGKADSGIDSLVDLICGADAPEAGRVVRHGAISWPIPQTSFIYKHVSPAANARFIARLYGQPEEAFVQRVAELGDIGEFMDEKMADCPMFVRSRLALAVGISVPFDLYILTATKAGRKEDQERVSATIQEACRNSALLLAGSKIKDVEDYCDRAFVLEDGHATYYDDMEAAAEHLKRIAEPEEGDSDEAPDDEPEQFREDF